MMEEVKEFKYLDIHCKGMKDETYIKNRIKRTVTMLR